MSRYLHRYQFRRSLKMNFSCPSGSIDEYLAVNFTYDSGLSPSDVAEMLEMLNKKDELRFYQLRGGGFIDLRAKKVQATLSFLQQFGVSRLDLENRAIQIPKCEIPYAAGLLEQAEARQMVEVSGVKLKSIEQSLCWTAACRRK